MTTLREQAALAASNAVRKRNGKPKPAKNLTSAYMNDEDWIVAADAAIAVIEPHYEAEIKRLELELTESEAKHTATIYFLEKEKQLAIAMIRAALLSDNGITADAKAAYAGGIQSYNRDDWYKIKAEITAALDHVAGGE